jgi:hypothetical protein
MSEVDVHGVLLLFVHFIGFDCVVEDWLTLCVVHDSISVLSVICIIDIKFEAE